MKQRRGTWLFHRSRDISGKRWGLRIGKGGLSYSDQSFIWRCWHIWIWIAGTCYTARTPFYRGPSK